MKHTLWTFDFTIITLGTIISAIGSVAMNFALSLVVFDQTSSTLATGIFAAVSFLPSTLIPLLCAPYVDTHIRKHIIVRLDAVSGLLYLIFSYYLLHHTFSYSVYMIFSLVIGSIGAVYNLAYTSLYPELITKVLCKGIFDILHYLSIHYCHYGTCRILYVCEIWYYQHMFIRRCAVTLCLFWRAFHSL